MDRAKKEKRKDIMLLVFLVLAFFVINYRFLDNVIENFLFDYETAVVERVIDGDTIVIDSGESVRLLGINAPERGEHYSDEAKKFLEGMVVNKTVRLEYSGTKYDKYGRLLAYLYIGKEDVNIELVRNGLANVYILDDKKNEGALRKAWEKCVEKDVGICEKSVDKCANCIELKKLDYTDQEIIFYNRCPFSCDISDWEIRDEGRKNYFFQDFQLEPKMKVSIIVSNGTDTDSTLYWSGESYVWTRAGDTLFLRDKKGKLALWENY